MNDEQMENLRRAFMKENQKADEPCPMSEQAMAYAFGELDPDEADKVEEHIHTCRHCLDLVMDIKLAEQEAEELKDIKAEVLPGLQKAIDKTGAPRDSILSKIGQAIGDFFFRGQGLKPVPAFATVAILIVAGVLMFRGPGDTPAPYAIEILMHGRTQVGLRGGQPEYKEFKVESGATLHSGDYFRFQTRIDKPAFVYVVFQDSAGKIEFMEKGLVPAGRDFFLPDGNQWFQLDKNTGTERLFMLASEKQIEDFGQKVDALRTAGIEKIDRIFPGAKIQRFSFSHE